MAVDEWLFDEVATFGADLEVHRPEPDEDDES